MKKRRVMALFMAAAMAATGMTGCGSSESATPTAAETAAETAAAEKGEAAAETSAGEAEGAAIDVKSLPAGSVDLSIMMPLGQWTDNFDILIDAYRQSILRSVRSRLPSRALTSTMTF
ncbi:hypothetical protein [Lacrimispora sp. 210928-DFI.3.58]|uniref:hypothetical protein n=1 Tax=Lacrimispora sp. 210928-DFI.3.58 TaxID=2883214 RepID=UPI001D095515|nr:hypothetical protein [Lacrimispora sp. 210928-DFI.3.58]MCB7318009.1 hypothetical protein [Lacrimispora sp. 210928-DFI.3.58]